MAIDLLSTGKAARALGVCRSTIRNLIRSGKLPAFRAGHHWRIHPEAVARLCEVRR